MWLFRPSQSGIARYLSWRNCAAILASAFASMDMIAGDLAMAGITAATSQSPLHATYPVGLSADRRYLVDPNNHPVFIVGEDAWALVTQLSDSDVDLYLSDRASRRKWMLRCQAVVHRHDPASAFIGENAAKPVMRFKIAQNESAAVKKYQAEKMGRAEMVPIAFQYRAVGRFGLRQTSERVQSDGIIKLLLDGRDGCFRHA